MKKILSMMMLLALTVGATSCDDDDNGVAINDKVRNYISVHYPDARILEAEYKYNLLEVEIYDATTKKDVYFDKSDAWVMTTWDIAVASLPEAVRAAASAAYPDYRIDDAEYVETPEGVHYSIELEKGGKDVYIKITPDGTIKP